MNGTLVEPHNTPIGRTWSPHQLKRWDRCQKQFELGVWRQLDWPSSTRNFELGKTVHKLLDFQSRDLPVDALLVHCSPAIQSTWTQLLKHPSTQWPIIASEWGFQIPLYDNEQTRHWLVGRIDRLAWHQHCLWIIDWKTGTATPRQVSNDWQTGFYLYAIWEARKSLDLPRPLTDPAQLRFVYVEVKQNEAIRLSEVAYSLEAHQAWHQRLVSTISHIQKTTVFSLPLHCPDRFCPYRSVCGIDS